MVYEKGCKVKFYMYDSQLGYFMIDYVWVYQCLWGCSLSGLKEQVVNGIKWLIMVKFVMQVFFWIFMFIVI